MPRQVLLSVHSCYSFSLQIVFHGETKTCPCSSCKRTSTKSLPRLLLTFLRSFPSSHERLPHTRPRVSPYTHLHELVLSPNACVNLAVHCECWHLSVGGVRVAPLLCHMNLDNNPFFTFVLTRPHSFPYRNVLVASHVLFCWKI